MNEITPPEKFEDFLYWVKETTERRWANFSESKKDGNWWNHKHELLVGAKWIDPLSEEEIDALEIKWKVKFPSDYRSFLKILHKVDKDDAVEDKDDETGEIAIARFPLFHDWRNDELIKDRFEYPFECIRYDVFSEIQPSWLKSWGTRPENEEECIAIFEKWKEKANILIPINSNRYLVSETIQTCPHILSTYGFDTILYSLNLREHLINELRWDLGLDVREYQDDEEEQKPPPSVITKAVEAIKRGNADSEAVQDDTEEDIFAIEAQIDASYEERRSAYITIHYWEEVILYWSSGWSSIGLKFPHEKCSIVQPIVKTNDNVIQKNTEE